MAKLPVFIFCMISLFWRFVAADTKMPAYPENPTASALAQYDKNMAAYYEQEAQINSQKAQQERAPHEINITKPFEGTNVGLGLIMNTGNTNTQSFNGTSFISYKPNQASTSTWNTTYANSRDSVKGSISDKLYTDLNSAFNLDFKNGIYGDINYTRDDSSGYDYQANESIGYNRVFFNTPKFSLSGQFGPGLQQNVITSSKLTQHLISANFKILSTYNFSDDTSWRETYNLTATRQSQEHTLDSMLITNLLNQFALQVDYLIDYDSAPLFAKKSLNTTTTVSLVYKF